MSNNEGNHCSFRRRLLRSVTTVAVATFLLPLSFSIMVGDAIWNFCSTFLPPPMNSTTKSHSRCSGCCMVRVGAPSCPRKRTRKSGTASGAPRNQVKITHTLFFSLATTIESDEFDGRPLSFLFGCLFDFDLAVASPPLSRPVGCCCASHSAGDEGCFAGKCERDGWRICGSYRLEDFSNISDGKTKGFLAGLNVSNCTHLDNQKLCDN